MVFVSVKIEFWEKYKHQILATLAVNIIAFSHGNAVAWVAPILPLLQSVNSPLTTGAITIEEASWIGSTVCAGGLIGSLTFGFLVSQIGRKKSMYLIVVPHVCFWLIIMFGTVVSHLYLARILSGVTGGGAFVVIPTYIADIADKRIRGTLGSIFMMSFNSGILSGYILASYLSYSLFPRVIIGLSIFYVVCIFSLPDTPQYLIRINKDEEAEMALRFYRNFNAETKEVCQEFVEHLANLKSSIRGNSGAIALKLSYKDFLEPAAVRGLCASIGLMFLNQFSGLFALVSYTSNIFLASGSTLDPNTCTVIVGSVQLLGTFFTAYLVDRIGRRALLIMSCLGVTIGSCSLGAFTFLSLSQDLSHLSWIAVTSVSFTILLGSFGLTPLPVVVLTEIMPPKVKAVAVTFVTCAVTIMAFTVLKLYPALIVNLGLYGVMWISGAITAVGALAIGMGNGKIHRCFFRCNASHKNIDVVSMHQVNTSM